MFLNDRALPARSVLAKDENAAALRRGPKSLGETGGKKAPFNENVAAKTPHGKKDAGPSKTGGQTARRRRALGHVPLDISNRKAGAGGGGKAGLGSKPVVKPGNNKALFPSTSSKPTSRTSQVTFSKTPSFKIKGDFDEKVLPAGGAKGAASKPKPIPAEYDGVIGITTRWSEADALEKAGRSPFDLIDREELDLVESVREKMWERQEREMDERARKKDEQDEEQWAAELRALDEASRDWGDLSGGIVEEAENDNAWDALDCKLGLDDDFDPAEERRLSRSDPYSLWGDDMWGDDS